MTEQDHKTQMAEIRAVVLRDGGCTVGLEQMRGLCADELTVAQRFTCIAEVARQDGWSFAFLPDGSVHFGTFTPGRM